MKTEYDFSNATRGKFFQNNAELNLPEGKRVKGVSTEWHLVKP